MRCTTLTGLGLFLVGLAFATAGGAPRKEDVPKYLEMLKSKTPGDRSKAADMLGKRGQIRLSDVKRAAEPLRELLKSDPDDGVRQSAARALGNMATEADKTVPALTEALKDKSLNVNMAAVNALSSFGTEARSAVPALREFAQSKNDKKIGQMVQGTIQTISGGKKKG